MTEARAPTEPADISDWRAGLPEDLRGEKSLAEIKGADWTEAGPLLAKGYVHAQKAVGAGLRMPKDDAKPEEWAEFYGKLGRPESPEKYEVKSPEMPKEMGLGEWDSETVKGFLKEAHAAGLSTKQAQRLMDWYGGYLITAADRQTQQAAEQKKATETTLRKEWGAAYGRNINLARQAVRDLFEGEAELAAAVEDAGNNPALVKGLVAIGERMMEHGELGGTVPPGETADEIQKKIDELDARLLKHTGNPSEMLDEKLGLIRRLQRAKGTPA